MRVFLSVAFVSAAVGCASEGAPHPISEAEWSAARDNTIVSDYHTLDATTSGVVFHPDGHAARVGLGDSTVDFEWETGQLTTRDLPGAQEHVVDGFGDRVLVSTSAGLYENSLGQGADADRQVVQGAHLNGALLDDGVVVMQERPNGVAIQWSDDGSRVTLPFDGTRSELSMDRTREVLWAASEEGLWRIDRASGVRVSDATQVAWDQTAQVAWTADGSVLAAMGADGSTYWSLDFGGELVDIETVGDHGVVIALVDISDTEQRLVMVDRLGELVGWTGMDERAQDLVVSLRAEQLAIQGRDSTLFAALHCP